MIISIFKRVSKAYFIISRTFGGWITPIFSGILFLLLNMIVGFFMFIDYFLFPSIRNKKIENPILIVGNPRSGTTFLHRYLTSRKLGTGSQLWQMLYSSVILQKLIKPFLPLLEKISPTRHHSTAAHKTSLQSVETDDASLLFRYFDGFFLYGFILSWSNEDLFNWVDPKKRDTSKRDFNWFESMWKRVLLGSQEKRIIGKLFSISANTPKFLSRFPDAKILYMVRDPLSVIPSGLSLVTGVLDKKFGFWSLPEEKRLNFINKLYTALVTLLTRFQDDWVSGRIDRDRVKIIHFDRMMNDFDGLMKEILAFIDVQPDNELIADIKETAVKQKQFKSKHQYDLAKFGLTQEKIKEDCKLIYETFLDKGH